MSTYREVIYLINDELRLSSDDSFFTEQHLLYIIDKYRAFLLKQRYSDIKKLVPYQNYQTLNLALEQVKGNMYSSYLVVPDVLNIGVKRVYKEDFYDSDIQVVFRERMRYVQNNTFLSSFGYASVNDEGKLIVLNPINKVDEVISEINYNAIFNNSVEAYKVNGVEGEVLLDSQFPLEEPLIPQLVELSLKELGKSVYIPTDNNNNANDDTSDVNVNR